MTHTPIMPRPMGTHTGKVTELRENLNVFRRSDVQRFEAEVQRIKSVYAVHGSIKATAAELKIGKRTLERAMRDIPELNEAIESVRVLSGR